MSEMRAAFQKWFDGYSNAEEPSAFDGFKAGWDAAVKASQGMREALLSEHGKRVTGGEGEQ